MKPQKREEFNKAWAKIIAKAWSDPAFNERLLKDPTGVLEPQGIEIPSGTHVALTEDTKDTFYLKFLEAFR